MIVIVLVLEIINTIIENIMDFLCKDYNLNIKIIKDYYKIDLKTAKELWDSIREQENQ